MTITWEDIAFEIEPSVALAARKDIARPGQKRFAVRMDQTLQAPR